MNILFLLEVGFIGCNGKTPCNVKRRVYISYKNTYHNAKYENSYVSDMLVLF